MVDSDIRVIDKVYYVADIKSKLDIKKFLIRTFGIGNYTFENVLALLGFDLDKKLYLKRKITNEKDEVRFYYSYDNDNFSEDNIIILDYYYFVKVINDGKIKEFYISKDYGNKGKIYLKSNCYERKKEIDGIKYYWKIYNGYFEILIKNGDGKEIRFSFNEIKNGDKFIYEFENNKELEEKICSIKFTDSMLDVFDKLKDIALVNEINWECIQLKYYNDGRYVADSSIEMRKKENIIYYIYLEEQVGNKTVFYRYEKRYENSFKFRNGGYGLEFDIVIKNDENIIKNEEKLRSYFLNLDFPIRIDELFKKICEIAMIDKEQCLKIELSSRNDDYSSDVIYIKNGALVRFLMTIGDRKIEVDSKGNFCYKNKGNTSQYYVNITDDVVTEYNYKCNGGIDNSDDCNRVMYRAIKEAKDEKVRVRKIVDEIIKY